LSGGIMARKMRFAFRGIGGRLSGSGNTPGGGSMMNYAHSQANVQTTRWLICLNGIDPHFPS
jgi:hypothetical protein